MNLKEYISSGIVENYVLGLTDPTESSDFERMCDAHPEVRAAREAFELALEEEALNNAIEPPTHLKSKIFSEIEIENEKRRPPVIPFSTETVKKEDVSRKIKRLQYFNIAALVLLIVSIAAMFYFYHETNVLQQKLADVITRNDQLAGEIKTVQASYSTLAKMHQVVTDPDMVEVKLPAAPQSPDPNSFATVFWGKTSKEVYLVIKKIPSPSTEKQYQLWAMVNGKPVDAGVFNDDTNFVQLKNIFQADAFAITLEKKGGSDTPTGQMYVLGTIKT